MIMVVQSDVSESGPLTRPGSRRSASYTSCRITGVGTQPLKVTPARPPAMPHPDARSRHPASKSPLHGEHKPYSIALHGKTLLSGADWLRADAARCRCDARRVMVRKALVTGVAGQDGTYLAEFLLE